MKVSGANAPPRDPQSPSFWSWTRWFGSSSKKRARALAGENLATKQENRKSQAYIPRYAARDAMMSMAIQDRDDVVALTRETLKRQSTFTIEELQKKNRRHTTMGEMGFSSSSSIVSGAGAGIRGFGGQCIHPNLRHAANGLSGGGGRPVSLGPMSSLGQFAREGGALDGAGRPRSMMLSSSPYSLPAIGEPGSSKGLMAQDTPVEETDGIAEALRCLIGEGENLNLQDPGQQLPGLTRAATRESLHCGAEALSPGRWDRALYHNGVTDTQMLQAMGLALPAGYGYNYGNDNNSKRASMPLLGASDWRSSSQGQADTASVMSDRSATTAAMASRYDMYATEQRQQRRPGARRYWSHENAVQISSGKGKEPEVRVDEGKKAMVEATPVVSRIEVVPSAAQVTTDPRSSNSMKSSGDESGPSDGRLTEQSRNASSADTAATASTEISSSDAVDWATAVEKSGASDEEYGEILRKLDAGASQETPGFQDARVWL